MDIIHPNNSKLIYDDVLDKYFQLSFVCSFRVYGKPIPKGSHKAFIRNGRAYITDIQKHLLQWQKAIRAEALKVKNSYTNVDWNNNAICLGLTFRFEHPKNHFTTKGKPSKNFALIHTKKPDFDKLARAVNDSLTGVLFKDDCRSFILPGLKFYGQQQGVWIQIYILSELKNE